MQKQDYQFFLNTINILQRGGDGEYVTRLQLKKFEKKFNSSWKKIYKEIEKCSREEKKKLAKEYRTPYPCSVVYCPSSIESKWISEITHMRLKTEKPELYDLPYETESAGSQMRNIVVGYCKSGGTANDVINTSLKEVLKKLEDGRAYITKYDEAYRRGSNVIGGGKEMMSFVEKEMKKWIQLKERSGKSIYSGYLWTFKKVM